MSKKQKYGEKYIYTHSLKVYTHVDIEDAYYILQDGDGNVIHVKKSFFEARYVPYTEETLEQLKAGKKIIKRGEKECTVRNSL